MSAKRKGRSRDMELALEEAGDCGLYHVWLMVLIALPYVIVGANMGASIYEGMWPVYYCDVDYMEWLEQTCNISQPDTDRISAALLTQKQNPECYRYNFNPNSTTGCLYWDKSQNDSSISSQPINDGVQACDSWIYDRSIMHETIVTEFSLVCTNTLAGYISQSTFMLGVLLGSIAIGWVGDRFGRRKAFLFCGLGMLVTGVATAFSQSFTSYLVLRCINGFFCYGLFPVLYILVSELVVARHRATLAQFAQVSFAVGLMLLALMAYCTREWRNLQLALSIPAAVTIILWWLLPESPRWLMANNKHVEAQDVIDKMRHVNAMPSQFRHSKEVTLPKDEEGSAQKTALKPTQDEAIENDNTVRNKQGKKDGGAAQKSLIDMIKHKNIRLVSFVLFYQWFVISCVYYALTLNAAELGGDPFINLFLNAFAEAIAVVLVVPLVNKAGRRLCGTTSEIVAGVFCFLVSKVPPDITWLLVGCSLVGKFAIAMSFSVAYIHVGELYPTTIRSVATGTCSAFARAGGIASPLIAMIGLVVPNLSYAIYAILSITSGLLMLLVPETNKQPLPETIEEGEAFIANNPGPLLIFLRGIGKKNPTSEATDGNDAL